MAVLLLLASAAIFSGSAARAEGPEISAHLPGEASAVDFRRQRVINQTLLRDPDAAVLLSRFEQQLQQADPLMAVELFQQLMQLPHDTFAWHSTSICPLRQRAMQIFETSPTLWSTYQQLYGRQSERVLDLQSPDSCRLVAQQFFFTPSGFQAMCRLASWAWDNGDLAEAAHLWQQLIASRFHESRLNERQAGQIAMIATLTHNRTLEDQLSLFLQRRGSRFRLLPPRSTESLSGWENLPTGTVRTLKVVSRDSTDEFETRIQYPTPPLREPLWGLKRELFRDQSAEQPNSVVATNIRAALEQWSAQQHEQLTPELTSLFAISVGRNLIYRDLHGVHAVEVQQNGTSPGLQAGTRPLWRFSSISPLLSAFEYEVDPYSGVTTTHPGVDRLYLSNSVAGTLTTDGSRVYLLDSVQRVDEGVQVASLSDVSEAPRPDEQPLAAAGRLINRLVALPLASPSQPSDASVPERTPLWTIDQNGCHTADTAARAPAPHPLQRHYFLGPPVVSRNEIYVLSERSSYIFLSALDPETGNCQWSQPISFVDRSIQEDVIRATRACLPVCAGGLIVCDNGNGQLIAIDRALGSLVWMHCYADDDARQESGRWTYTQSTRVSQPGAWNLPVVCGNHILLMPDRSHYIQCCDLATGQLLWKRPREDGEYLAGINSRPLRDNAAISSGAPSLPPIVLSVGARCCRALNVTSGETAWESRSGFVSGHGVQVGTQFLLPTFATEPIVAVTETDAGGPAESSASSSGVKTTSSGRLTAIDLRTGERAGYDLQSMHTGEPKIAGRAAPGGSDVYAFPLGNLLVCDDLIVSVGMNQILAFPQAGAVVRQLDDIRESRELTESELRQFAQAELVLGNIPAAKQHLQLALSRPLRPSQGRAASRMMYRELLYQELRERTSAEVPGESLSILEELERLADSPEQQARYLLTEIELLLDQGNYTRLWQVTDRFAAIGLNVPLPPTTASGGYLATSASWIPGVYERIFRQLTPQEKQTLLRQVEQQWLSRLNELSEAQLHTFLEAFSLVPTQDMRSGERNPLISADLGDGAAGQVRLEIAAVRDVVRLELVERALHAGQLQKAELLLLELRKSPAISSQLLACQGLITLYSRIGLYRQAGIELQELSALALRHADHLDSPEANRLLGYLTSRQSDQNGAVNLVAHFLPPTSGTWLRDRDYLVHFDRQHPSWLAYQNGVGLSSPVQQVSIQRKSASSPLTTDPYARRRLLCTLPQQGWSILQQVDVERKPAAANNPLLSAPPAATTGDEQHFVVVNSRTGHQLVRIALPGSRIGVSNATPKQTGHLLPVTVEGDILGISLLEGRPVWQRNGESLDTIYADTDCEWETDASGITRPTADSRINPLPRPRRIELGPVGPGYCLVQTARALCCLNPIDGRLLWKRTDLDPQGGLWADRGTGLFGDERALVYLHPDQNSYTVLETGSGKVLHRGQLVTGAQQLQRTRQVFGRRLMYLTVSTQADHERRLRIWDPLAEQLALDEPFGSRDLYHAADEELTLLLATGRLLVYRPGEDRTVIDLQLPEDSLGKANYLRTLRCGDRYLVNLYQTQRLDNTDGYASRFTDTPLELTHINGPLLSINALTGQLEWMRVFPNRSIIAEQPSGLPFLIMCANHQLRPGDQQRTLLMEVVDTRTGETLELRDDLPSVRLLQVDHDRAAGEVRLISGNDIISIAYSSKSLTRIKRLYPEWLLFARQGQPDCR